LKRKLKFSGRFALTSVAASLLLASPLASALGLGRLSVQSSLGEVLRAEIEVTSLTPKSKPACASASRPPSPIAPANVDYNPVLPSTRASFEKRADGRLFVRLVSDRGVQEPFVDVILEISWATGRLVREYTLLFDPPATIRAGATPAPGTSTSPVISAAPPAPAPLPPTAGRPPSAREQREASRAEARERKAAAKTAARGRQGSLGTGSRVRPRPRRLAHRKVFGRRVPGSLRRLAVEDRGAHAAPGRIARPDARLAVPRQSERLQRQQHEPPQGGRRSRRALG
jgi:pilus assembly protein FimV